jgi:hypothetical protein
LIYEETKGDIDPFLKLYRLSKAAGMNVQQVVNLQTIRKLYSIIIAIIAMRLIKFLFS